MREDRILRVEQARYHRALDNAALRLRQTHRTTSPKSGVSGWWLTSPVRGTFAAQGWKVHVSCSWYEAADMVKALIPFLHGAGFAFKLPADLDFVVSLTSNRTQPAQIGKILTVYAGKRHDAVFLAKRLMNRWPRSDGPRLRSDILLAKTRHVGLRFGSFRRQTAIDGLGRAVSTVQQPNGLVDVDVRTETGAQPQWVSTSGIPAVLPTHFAQAAARLPGATWWPIAVLQDNSKGNVCLAMRQEPPHDVAILKRAHGGVLVGSPSQDAEGCLRREHAVHLKLGAAGFPAPSILGFSTGDMSALVLEDLQGSRFDEVEPVLMRRAMPSLLIRVSQLHHAGFVHRDIKPANVLIRNGQAELIDFELTCPIDSVDPVVASTPGYCRPDQQTSAKPSRDFYALAQMVLFSALQADLIMVQGRTTRALDLLRCAELTPACRWYRTLISGKADLAALAGEMSRAPDTWRFCHRPRKVRPSCRGRENLRRWALTAAIGATARLKRFETATVDGRAWWNARNEGDSIAESINRGAAGIILSLMTVQKITGRVSSAAQIKSGCDWLATRSIHRGSGGLFTGNAGVALILSAAALHYRRNDWSTRAREYFLHAFKYGADDPDFFFGQAGILWAGTCLYRLTKRLEFLIPCAQIAQRLCNSVEERQGILAWSSSVLLTGERVRSFGAAHGACGIALALACWGDVSGDTRCTDLSTTVLSRLWSLACVGPQRQLLSQQGDVSRQRNPHLWCHGSGGLLWTLLHLPRMPAPLEDATSELAKVLVRSPASGNCTLCHGLSGRVELLRILASRAPDDCTLQAGLEKTVRSLRTLATRHESGLSWPAEDGALDTPELWCGFMGPASSLAMYYGRISTGVFSMKWLEQLSRPCAAGMDRVL